MNRGATQFQYATSPAAQRDGSENEKRSRSAFTLLELLVVIAIIGILTAIGIPALKGLGKTNLSSAVKRQVLDDLGYARMRAIGDRTTVYMVFMPAETIFQRIATETDRAELQRLTNLITGQLTAYALVAKRTVGDQPGQHTTRYLTDWQRLPEGAFFSPRKFDPALKDDPNPLRRAYPTGVFPFPTAKGKPFVLPYIAFDPQGQLLSARDETVAVSQGSIFYPRDDRDQLVAGPPDVIETPKGNEQVFWISWLTGRAEAEEAEFK